MNPIVKAFDHVLVGVASLEAARRNWQRLGFTACPRGRHIGWGTANYCLMFPENYIELIGIVDPEQFTNSLDRFLAERGEGVLAAAYRTLDAEADSAALRERGLAVEGPQDLMRLIEHPDDELRPRFRLLHFDPASRPGLLAFLCQHLTPEMVWQQPWLRHANGAQAVTRLLAVTEDLRAPAETAVTWFGDARVRSASRMVLMGVDDFTLELLHPETAQERYQGMLAPELLGPFGFTVAVRDLAACQVLLKKAGVTVIERPGLLIVPPVEANGVLLEFINA